MKLENIERLNQRKTILESKLRPEEMTIVDEGLRSGDIVAQPMLMYEDIIYMVSPEHWYYYHKSS